MDVELDLGLKRRQLAFEAGGAADVAVKDEKTITSQVQKVGFDARDEEKEDPRPQTTSYNAVTGIVITLALIYIVLRANAVGLDGP